jgi:hypothetical protein
MVKYTPKRATSRPITGAANLMRFASKFTIAKRPVFALFCTAPQKKPQLNVSVKCSLTQRK